VCYLEKFRSVWNAVIWAILEEVAVKNLMQRIHRVKAWVSGFMLNEFCIPVFTGSLLHAEARPFYYENTILLHALSKKNCTSTYKKWRV
jgi:hypothetical protein